MLKRADEVEARLASMPNTASVRFARRQLIGIREGLTDNDRQWGELLEIEAGLKE